MLLQTAHFHGEMNLDNNLKLQMVPITIKCTKIMILPSTLTNSYQFCDIRDLVGEPLVQSCFQIILVTLLRSPISVLWDELIYMDPF
jgi:hypothetical protein